MKNKDYTLRKGTQDIVLRLKDTGIFKYPFILWFLFAIAITFTYTGSQAFLYLLLILYFIKLIRKKVRSFPPKLYSYFYLLFFISALISIAFSIDQSASSKILRLILQLLLVYMICDINITKDRFIALLWVFFIGCTAGSVYAVMQRIGGIKRVSGFFGDYQSLAGVLSISILILSSYLINAKIIKKRLMMIISFALFLHFIALYFTFTRSALIGLVFGYIVIFFLKARWTLFVFLSFIFLLIGFSLFYPKTEIGDLVLSIMFPRDRTSSRFIVNRDRMAMYQDSITIARKYPLTGIGYETLSIVYNDPESEFDLTAPKHYTRISSNYFYVLVSAGIPGLVIFTSFLISTMLLMMRLLRPIDDRIYRPFIIGTIASFIFFMISGIFEPVFFDPSVRLGMYFLVGLVFLISNEQSEARRAKPEE